MLRKMPGYARFLALTVLLATAQLSLAQDVAYVKAGTKEICAGIEVTCKDYASCTKLYVGPCVDADYGPQMVYTSSFVGLAFVNSTSNYNNAQSAYVVEGWQNANNGYRDFSGNIDAGTGAYAYVANGGHVGDPAVMGGYISVANHLATRGSITTKYNTFPWADPGQARVSKGDSTLAAPKLQEACIVPRGTDGKCGSEVTFNEGDMKFSIYGHTLGSNYNYSSLPLNTVAALGFRMRYAIVGAAALSVTFNSGKSLDDVSKSYENIKDIKISTPETGEITFTMPSSYNVGNVADAKNPTATKTVKVVALPAKAEGKEVAAMYLDYLFEASDLNGAGKFFVYDPSVKAAVAANARAAQVAAAAAKAAAKVVTTTSRPSTTPTGKSSASTLSTSALSVVLAFATAAFVRFF